VAMGAIFLALNYFFLYLCPLFLLNERIFINVIHSDLKKKRDVTYLDFVFLMYEK